MEPQVISSFYTRTEQLPSNKVRSLHSEIPLAFYIETGDADIFYMENLPGGPGRRLFLLRISAPFLVPCFTENDSLSLVISALSNCTIGILDSGSLNRLLAANPDYARSLLEKWLAGISDVLDHFGIMPQISGKTAIPTFSADILKNYSGSDEKLLALWFGFNESIIPILKNLCAEDQKIALEHVKDTYAFRKNAVYNALSRFKAIISGKTTDDLFGDVKRTAGGISASLSPRMLLLQTCQLIGKE